MCLFCRGRQKIHFISKPNADKGEGVQNPPKKWASYVNGLVPYLVDDEAVLGQVSPRHRSRVRPQQEEDVGLVLPDGGHAGLVAEVESRHLAGHPMQDVKDAPVVRAAGLGSDLKMVSTVIIDLNPRCF